MGIVDALFPPGTEVKARYPDKFKGKVTDDKPSGRNQGKIPVDSGRKTKWFYPSELQIVKQSDFISRDREWSIGDRCQLAKAKSAGIITDINGASVRVRFSDAADSTGKGAWVSKEHICRLELVDCLKESEDSHEQRTSLEDSTGESQLSKAQALVRFCDRNSIMKSGREISEDFTQTRESMICSSVDSPAPELVTPDLEPDLTIQNQVQCSGNSSELSEKLDPHLCFWNSLQDLSIADLERGLEDCEWGDIKASIQLSRELMNLGRNLRGRESLSFPTLLAGHGGSHRDAGQVECERWFKKFKVIPVGSQLSAPAIASMHGFPADWFAAISPLLYGATTDTQEELQPENLEAKPLQSPRPELPSNGLNGSGQSFPREWKLGDRIELIKLIDKKCRRAIGDTGIIDEVKASLIQVKWDKKRPKTNSWTIFSNDTSSIRLINQYPAANQSPAESLENLTIEQQLEPRTDDCLGKTVYHDIAEKLGTVTHLELEDLGGDLPTIRYAHVAWWWKFCQNPIFNTEQSRVPADELELVSDEQLVYELTCEVKSLGKCPSKQIGSLYQYTSNHRGKDGIIREYPIVEGERHRDNDEHWYWGLSFIEKNHRGKWCDRSASIPSKSLALARQLMREKFLYTNTIAISQLKFLWMEEKGRYLIGEIKPEACPRLCVVSLDEKNYILAAANWGELRVGDRMALSRKVREAIERYQPLSVIRGLLS